MRGLEHLRISELIGRALWREAVTYRNYVASRVHPQPQGRSARVDRVDLCTLPRRGERCRHRLPAARHLLIYQRLQVLALGHRPPRRRTELRAGTYDRLSRPARLRGSAGRYRQARILPLQTRSIKSEDGVPTDTIPLVRRLRRHPLLGSIQQDTRSRSRSSVRRPTKDDGRGILSPGVEHRMVGGVYNSEATVERTSLVIRATGGGSKGTVTTPQHPQYSRL